MFVHYDNRSREIKGLIDGLRLVLPYPMVWYDQKADKQIRAMARNYADRIKEAARKSNNARVKAAMEADEREVRKRLGLDEQRPEIMPVATKKHIVGTYELTVANRRSLRFKFIKDDGTVAQAIVSRMMLRGFTLGAQTDCLPPRHVCMAWESGKMLTMTVDQMIAKILGSATNNPKELVQELYRIAGSSKQNRIAN